MAMILKENEACRFASKCKYNSGGISGTCQGANPNRKTVFTCEFVVNGKIIENAGFRNSLDQTGKMKIIME